jgi:XTP/dITP diphosphohydrolase
MEPQSQTENRVLVIATGNAGKLVEIQRHLADLPLTIRSLADYPPVESPEEDQATFEGNARLKARYYAAKVGAWVLADDSGIEVDALGGAPGVHSARYAGEPSNDAANNAKLLRELAGVPTEKRSARFRCALCISGAGLPEGEQVFFGVVEGVVLTEPRGEGGFGYDPLFFHPGLGCTTAEIPLVEKNKISHRGRALDQLKTHLLRVLR